MNRSCVSIFGRVAGLALLLVLFLPIATHAQRRHRSRIVIYQNRPYVVYQRRPVYGYRYNTYTYSTPYYSRSYYSTPYYSRSYYSTPYYSTYSYDPYYASRYYGYGYSQPYYTDRYTYAEPGYRYYNVYRPRYRRSGISFRLSF